MKSSSMRPSRRESGASTTPFSAGAAWAATSNHRKLNNSERHGPPLTTQVDAANQIFELRVGSTNIARVFFFFQPGREIIVTNGYVKKRQRLDPRELQRAREYRQDWIARHQ